MTNDNSLELFDENSKSITPSLRPNMSLVLLDDKFILTNDFGKLEQSIICKLFNKICKNLNIPFNIELYENGNKRKEAYFVDNNEDGIYKIWDNQQKIMYILLFERGCLVKKLIYNTDREDSFNTVYSQSFPI